jgi:hypothetical protein
MRGTQHEYKVSAVGIGPSNLMNPNQQPKMSQNDKNSKVKLKLVMIFDPQKQIYRICSHNLLPEDALAEVTELRRDGLPAFMVDQRSCHFQPDAEKCETCLADVRQRANSPPTLKGESSGYEKKS